MAATPKLKWINESKANPGYSVYYARSERDPGTMYVIRYKRARPDYTPVGWRTFARTPQKPALVTIYVGDSLKESKAFVQDLEDQLTINQGNPAAVKVNKGQVLGLDPKNPIQPTKRDRPVPDERQRAGL